MFLHDALDEYITCGETDVVASNLRARMNKLRSTGFQEQFQVPLLSWGDGMAANVKFFQLLDQVSCHVTEDNCTVGAELFNKNKNRYMDRLPCKRPHPYLQHAYRHAHM